MSELPETVLQFGAGNFLRAFTDLFIEQMNAGPDPLGKVVVVQSTDSSRAASLSQGDGSYHVAVRGKAGGRVVDDVVRVTSISRAINARTDWQQVLAFAESPTLKLIVSNVTEAGMSLAGADDDPTLPTPASFPAKLLRVLERRFNAGLPGLPIVSCELIEDNGDKTQRLCLDQAMRWSLPVALSHYIKQENQFLNSLVDRIVPGKPANHPLLACDPNLTMAEPYALWAIQTAKPEQVPLKHESILLTPDVRPYTLRKLRMLNGSHTALVTKALPMGLATVREAIEHSEVGPWLRAVLFEEIVPTLEGKVDGARLFAEQVLERFANPFLEHKLSDIAVNHAMKIRNRIDPTVEAFRQQFGRPPEKLSWVLQNAGSVH